MDVLDRLEEDDRVARLGVVLDEAALEAQVGSGVAKAGVLVRLGVGVDADDLGGRARQRGRAVALAAGEIGHAEAARARGDPLVDGQVAAVPVVLLGHVGQRALARERERRHAVGLVFLHVGHERRREDRSGRTARYLAAPSPLACCFRALKPS